MKLGLKFLFLLTCFLGFLAANARAQGSTDKVDEVTPYIKSIAKALNHDPVRIYEWVKNNVDFTPYHGFKRGAHLTALELQGNDFDSSALLVALLKACERSDWSVTYHWDTISVSYSDHDGQNATAWLVADKETIPSLFVKAGVNATNTPAGASVELRHMWVEFTTPDATYKLTPAFKSYSSTPKFDLARVGFSSASLLTEVAGVGSNVPGTTSATRYTGNTTGKNALRTRLNTYTTALVEHVSKEAHHLSGKTLLGHRDIEFSRIEALPTQLPPAFSTPVPFWNSTTAATSEAVRSVAIPADLCPKFSIKIGNLTRTFYTAELQGKKLTAWFTANAAELWLDDTKLATEVGFDAATPADVEFSFIYHYGTDTRPAAPLARNGKYVISYAFGRVLGRLNERLRIQSDYTDRKLSGTGRQLMSENLYVMSLQYLNLLAEMNEIAGCATDTRIHFLHHAGIAGQKEVPYVDLPMNTVGVWPTRPQINPAADEALARRVFLAANYWFSMLEHTTIEQMLPGEGVSTVKMVQKAVELGNPVYLAKSWNDYAGTDGISGIRALLTNYPGTQTTAREINNIEDGLRAGGTLLIPQNASMIYNDYKGTGYMLRKPESGGASVMMGISGGMAGGWFSSLGGGSMASVASTADYQINPNFLSISPAFKASYIQDPVDMTNGSFYHTVTDLALSGDSVHGLSLNRRYSSARRTANPVGMGKGWTHSYNMQLEFRHPNDFSLARASVAEVAPFLVAIKAITDIYNPEATAKEGVIPALIACWLGDQLIDTRATISLGEQDMDFVKLPDGTYAPPPGASATLTKSGTTHILQFRKGSALTFRSDGKCTTVTDKNNSTGTARSLAITYTSANYPNRVTDAYGRYLQFNYAGDNRLSSVADSTGRSVHYSTDQRDGKKVFVVQDPKGNITRYYLDDKNRIIELMDARGRTIVTSEYNDWDQITEQQMQGLPSREGTMGFAFGVTRDTDPENHTAWSYYDARGRVHTSVNPMGAVSTTDYDGNDRIILTVNSLGEINEIYYDQNHEPILVKDALEQTRLIRPESDDSVSWFRREFNFEGLETITRYYPFHKPQSVTAPGGITEEYEYDTRGRVTKHRPTSYAPGQWVTYVYTEASGYLKRVVATYPIQEQMWNIAGTPAATTEISDFDARGNLIQFIDRRGKKSTYTYDANRRLLEEAAWTGNYTAASPVGGTPPVGSFIRTLTYDANGDRQSETADGKTFTYEHDAEGRPLSAWGPDGVLQSEFYYDARGLGYATVDALGGITTTYYDAARRPVESFDEIFRRVETQYDLLGRPITSITPRGYATTTEYDELGRVKKVVDPRNGTANPIEYDYDKDGRQTALKNRRAKTYSTDYADLLRQVTTKTPLDATNPPRSTQTSRNERGLPVTITEPSGQTTTFVAYDNEGRVTLQQDGDGVYTKYTYHPGGLPYSTSEPVSSTGAVISGTRTTTSAYDDFGRLTSYSDGEGNTIGYAYDSSGNLQRLTYPGGFTVGYTYDDYNRMVGVLEWASPPTTVVPAAPAAARTTTYTYDALGRVSTTTRANGTQREQIYDAASQLMAIEEKRTTGANPSMIWARAFRYDEAGRNGAFYLNDGEITYTYTWPSPQSPIHWPQEERWYFAHPFFTVTYNEDNQLASFNGGTIDYDLDHDPDGNMITAGITSGSALYGYDSRNRLTSAGGSNYRYNPDGLRVQITGTGAATYVVDPNGLSRVLARTVGGTTTRYVWGLGLLYQVTGSTVRYYHSDQVGSTVAITDGAGAVTDRFDYLSFGRLDGRIGTTTTPFLYNGASGVETDANGLFYMRARYYSPMMMRFINADPIRFEGGMNWYAFAGNNPMSYTDPTGTEREMYHMESLARQEMRQDDAMLGMLSITSGLGIASVGAIPVGGDWIGVGQDVYDLSSSDSSALDRALAGASLTANAWTLGAAPNFGPIKRGLGSAADGFRAVFGAPEKVADGSVRFKRWARGDAIDKPMPDGSAPSWDVVRSRYWKNRSEAAAPGEFSTENLRRMQRGTAPQDFNRRTGQFESRELHHVDPQRSGGSNGPFNLREVTPDQHRALDPYRQ